MIINIHNFYLNTDIPNYEYIRIPITIFSQNIIHPYKLQDLVTINGYVYMEIRKGMYGLPRVGKLANNKV